jgi:hypothetical protein
MFGCVLKGLVAPTLQHCTSVSTESFSTHQVCTHSQCQRPPVLSLVSVHVRGDAMCEWLAHVLGWSDACLRTAFGAKLLAHHTLADESSRVCRCRKPLDSMIEWFGERGGSCSKCCFQFSGVRLMDVNSAQQCYHIITAALMSAL